MANERVVGWTLVVAGLLASGSCKRARSAEAPDAVERVADPRLDTGPHWAIVEDYLEQQRTSSRPDAHRAIAAARAVLEAGGVHGRTVEAAEFLLLQVDLGDENRADQHLHAGAKALLEHAPGYERWPRVLNRMHHRRDLGPAVDAFFEDLASEAEDPALRATGQYYVAAGLMREANMPGGVVADAKSLRQRALVAATGLSAGAEQLQFLGVVPSRPKPLTLAEAEADLIRSITHGTVAGTMPDMVGTRLDGTEDRVSRYRGRVLLLDFWATWCPPCVTALPKLRELVAELPAARFALVAISVDEEREAVTRFLADQSIPWTVWHAGPEGGLAQLLRISFFPTYILVDERGEILARGNVLEEFEPLIAEAPTTKEG